MKRRGEEICLFYIFVFDLIHNYPFYSFLSSRQRCWHGVMGIDWEDGDGRGGGVACIER